MPLKVVVELQIHAVSCPGVYLTEKNDVYLHVCILGQCKETDCLPPIFPLLFRERMWFEKIFENATDPVAVVEQLEKSVAKIQLSELISSEKEDIAFYEANTRDFLFPEPKLTPAYPGVDRELLMNTHPSFPGIAPKLEFSTRTTITEIPLLSRRRYRDRHKNKLQRAASASPRRRSISPAQCRATKKKNGRRLTRSLRSRSPSPRSPRHHLHELCRENQQHLSPLSLKSVKFKAETDYRPPFVVRHSSFPQPRALWTEYSVTLTGWPIYWPENDDSYRPVHLEKAMLDDVLSALSFDSWKTACPAAKVIREPDGQDSLSLDSSSPKAKESASCLSNNPTFCHEASFASPLRYRSPSPEGYNAMMLISRDKEE
ncbi:spermatogenesis associated 6-like protein [Varanus komodoensis]|uniref:spermatogenesis associated 6-like protein n=1 Tax=Varanus komodoensis TaxID=61221 RepID=UPI001CF7B050|nr:spermatogenesis associated 6-like protein [Varanus komodoensis]